MSFWDLVDKYPIGFGFLAFLFIIVAIPTMAEAWSMRGRR